MRREEKAQLVDWLRDKLSESSAVFLTDFTGLTVKDMIEFRRKVKSAGGIYKVVKNTLYRIALSGSPHEALKEHTRGPTGVVFSFQDPVVIAKLLVDFSKDNPNLSIKKACLEGRVLEAEEVEKLAKLPPRDQLLGKLMGLLASPQSGFVYALKWPLVRLVMVMNAIMEKKKQSEGG